MGRDWTEEVNGAAYMNAEPTGLEGSQVARIDPEKEALRAQRDELLEACRAWEAWEADIILNADWGNDTPRLTQEQWDRVIELQVMRNAAIAKAEGSQG